MPLSVWLVPDQQIKADGWCRYCGFMVMFCWVFTFETNPL